VQAFDLAGITSTEGCPILARSVRKSGIPRQHGARDFALAFAFVQCQAFDLAGITSTEGCPILARSVRKSGIPRQRRARDFALAFAFVQCRPLISLASPAQKGAPFLRVLCARVGFHDSVELGILQWDCFNYARHWDHKAAFWLGGLEVELT
jgi:hypothetical protein